MNTFAMPNRDIFSRLNDVKCLSVVSENVLRFLFSSHVTLVIQAKRSYFDQVQWTNWYEGCRNLLRVSHCIDFDVVNLSPRPSVCV